MKAVLALAFLAVANAAFPILDDGFVPAYDGLTTISPLMARSMFHKFGFMKPALDGNFISFARSVGVMDYPTIGHMHALYDEPAIMFFMDSMGGMVSYYADAGIEAAMLSPELRAVFPSVLGAADSMAIVYHPDSVLGSYKSVLPGQFFVPSHCSMLTKIMRTGLDALPVPMEHVILRRPEIAEIFPEISPVFARFDIDEFPFAYKSPVALSLLSVDHSAGLIPSTGLVGKSFGGLGVSPFSPIIAKTAHPLMSAFSPSYLRAATPLIHSGIPAYHSGFIPSLKFPLVKSIASYNPIMYAKPSLKVLHYPTPIASVAPIAPISSVAPISVVDAATPVVDDLRGFNPFVKAFPSYYPSYYPSFYPSYYPGLRYPAPIFQSPIVPAAAGIAGAGAGAVAGASAASMAAASSMAGAESATLI